MIGLGATPILLLGSKRHMLADLFAAPGAPLSACSYRIADPLLAAYLRRYR